MNSANLKRLSLINKLTAASTSFLYNFKLGQGQLVSGGLMENLNFFVRSVFAVSVVSQYVSRQKVFKIALDTCAFGQHGHFHTL